MTSDSDPGADKHLEGKETTVIEDLIATNERWAEKVTDSNIVDRRGVLYTSNYHTYMDDLIMVMAVIVFVDGKRAFAVHVRDAALETSTGLAMTCCRFLIPERWMLASPARLHTVFASSASCLVEARDVAFMEEQ